MKETKRHTHKNIIDGRKRFIGCIQKTGENDLDKLRVNDSGHNEGHILSIEKVQRAVRWTLNDYNYCSSISAIYMLQGLN